MKRLNDRQMGMLRCVAIEPRTAHSFTHGPASISPHIVLVYLDHMVAAGLIVLAGKSYTATEKGRALLDAQPEPVVSRYYGNASTPSGSYTPPRWQSVRPGADDHEQYRSRGV